MLEYEFEEVWCDEGKRGWDLMGGFSIDSASHQEIIRRRAAEGWRYVGFLPKRQRAAGFLEIIDLVFERHRPEAGQEETHGSKTD